MQRTSGSGRVRGAAAAVLAAATWMVAAGRISVWFDLETGGFGGTGFAAPAGTTAHLLEAACLAVGLVAIATLIRPREPLPVVLAILALVLSVAGLVEWASEATLRADSPVAVLVSPSPAGWFVLASLVALQGAAIALLPRRRPIVIAVGALMIATVAVGVLAPDRLSSGPDGTSVIR